MVEGNPCIIARVKIPHRPKELGNCYTSGCVFCVWEYHNEDLRH